MRLPIDGAARDPLTAVHPVGRVAATSFLDAAATSLFGVLSVPAAKPPAAKPLAGRGSLPATERVTDQT
jgi:hypothetical protein